jgi:hypothetical protein
VTADIVARLLLQPPPPAPGVVSRLRLIGARITRRLVLRYATIAIPIALVDCEFDEPVELDYATLCATHEPFCSLGTEYAATPCDHRPDSGVTSKTPPLDTATGQDVLSFGCSS